MARCWTLLGLIGLLTLTGCVRQQKPPDRGWGTVDFEVSCTRDAQWKINDGVALLHSLMFAEAERIFFAATAADPQCAMAHWGVAMARIRPLWPQRPGSDDLQRGTAALAAARELGLQTERESAWVEATAAFFESAPDDAARVRNWTNAMDALVEKYDDDVDAAAFHETGRLAMLPTGAERFAARQAIGERLERLLGRAPEHPGVLLNLVLAYDHPDLAERARIAAEVYADVCHGIAQGEHVPTRVGVWLGDWIPVIHGNLAASAAALDQAVNGAASLRFALSIDYLMYAYMQSGHDRRASGILEHRLARAPRVQDDLVSAWSLAAIPARYHLERHAWEEAAQLEPRQIDGISSDSYPTARALTLFARGLGAARSGDSEAARRAIAETEPIRDSLEVTRPLDARSVTAQMVTIDAWIAHSEGKREAAVERMREAAELGDGPAPPVLFPAGPLPLRELLGDMLLEVGNAKDALREYEACLKALPYRFNSLLGAARAARALDDPRAVGYFERLLRQTEASGSDRPELTEAREYLEAS